MVHPRKGRFASRSLQATSSSSHGPGNSLILSPIPSFESPMGGSANASDSCSIMEKEVRRGRPVQYVPYQSCLRKTSWFEGRKGLAYRNADRDVFAGEGNIGGHPRIADTNDPFRQDYHNLRVVQPSLSLPCNRYLDHVLASRE